MKKIFIILAVILIFGCESQTEEQRWKDYQAKQDSIREAKFKGFRVIVIDSCEYLIKEDVFNRGTRCESRVGYLSHKGNCKFCEERRKTK